MTPLAKRLRRLREKQNVTASALDVRAGLTIGHTAMIERGERQNPSYTTVVKLAKALGVSVAHLMVGT